MHRLTTLLVGRACRLFLDLAYPDGPDSIPANKRIYYDLPADQGLDQFIPPAPAALGVCQGVAAAQSCQGGFAFRLGSAHFPHLKLKVLLMEEENKGTTWVYVVDTHDAFARDRRQPPPDHPDAQAWLQLQEVNRRLKEQIETVLETAGFVTFNRLLKQELR